MSDLAKLVVEVDDKGVIQSITSLKAFQVQAGKATVAAGALNKTAKTGKKYWTSYSSQIKTVGRDLSRYLTLPLLAAGVAGIKFATDLNKGLGQVQTLIPNTGDRIYELKDAVMSMSKESGKGFDDLTTGLYETVSAFQDGEDTVGRFNAAVRAGIAGNASTVESVKLISAVTKAYGDTSTAAAQKVSDLAFETVRLGQTTFKELASGIQVATASADRLGVSQEELFNVFATLTGVLGDASEVATKFRSASASLLNPTATLSALFRKMGVASGEALIKQEGLLGAFQAIKNESEATGTPLQKYIKRIEGITLVTLLAGKQADTFASKLLEIKDFAGATDQAVTDFTTGINKLGFQLSQAKQELITAAVVIGNDLLPQFILLVQKVTELAQAYADASEGTRLFWKNLAIGVALIGPMLTLVGSVGKLVHVFGKAKVILPVVTKAFAAFASGGLAPVLLAILGPVGLVVGLGSLISKTKEMGEQFQEERDAIIDVDEALVNASVSSQVATIAKYNEAIARQQNITAMREERTEQIRLDLARTGGGLFLGPESGQGEQSQVMQDAQMWVDKSKEAEKVLQDSLNHYTNTLQVRTESVQYGTLKSWQQWLEDLTGVSTGMFAIMGKVTDDAGKETIEVVGHNGRTAINEYFKILQEGEAEARFFAEKYGQAFDNTEYVDGQVDALKELLTTLINIPEDQIFNGDTFLLEDYLGADKTDASIQRILELIKQLTKTATDDLKGLGDSKGFDDIFKAFETNKAKIGGFSEMRKELRLASDETGYWEDRLSNATTKLEEMYAAGYRFTDDPFSKTTQQMIVLGVEIERTQRQVDLLTLSWDELLKKDLAGFLQETIGLSEKTSDVFADLGVSIATMGVDLLADSFYDLGRAIHDSSEEGYAYNDMLADMGQTVLDLLPSLFIQAGLALLSTNVGLGLGLIAAGLAGEFIAGSVAGSIDSESANGNVFSGGNIIPFRNGGSFTNSIVDSPTLFPFADGTGLMGEAGAEAIMPLTRTATGELGVRSEGGGSNVNVFINNNSGSDVTTEEKEGPDGGKEIYVTIGNVVKSQMANGSYDRAMGGRYGIRAKGIA